MDRSEQENIIKTVVSGCANEEGWANLADVGNKLREADVKYGKLSKFFDSFKNIVEVMVNKDIDPPVAYVKLVD